MLKILDSEHAIEIIAQALVTGGKGHGMDGDYESPVYITLRDGGRTRNVESYELDPSSVRLIAAWGIDPDDRDQWDGSDDAVAIFELPGGYFGVAYEHNWWGPTFGGVEYSMDISENGDWESFCNFSLTDEDREILSAFTNTVVGLTSSNSDVRALAQEIYTRPKSE